MKKLYLISLLMMAILTSYSQEPVVSFACRDENNNPQRLDSVRIENWTRSWAVTIYYPNLSISLGDVTNGITDLEFDEEGLARNIPNPFDGRTRAQLTLSDNEHIIMRVFDITGKAVAYYEGQIEAGKHNFDIVLSTPQTYILQVVTSKKTYAIKMVNTGRGGEDKISLQASNNEVVLKSARQIMDYDFEAGDCMHYQGFVTVGNEAVRTDPITQNQYDSELITFVLHFQQTTTAPVGIYAGVVGFNNQLYVKPIDVLNNSTSNSFHSFINNLPMGNGTILYHADYTALNNIASAIIPDELINVTLVTFTDGLDLGSWRMNPFFSSETEYLNVVHNRILNDQLGGVNITAYAIGVRGNDVTDTARFRHDLRMLSSDPNHNVYEVANISEVNAQFREVAAQLNQTTVVTTDISLLLPAPDPGTRVRFTFDNVTSAASSYYYIEGTYTYNNGVGKLVDIVYEGLTSTSGGTVTGIAQGIFDRFVFTDVKDLLQQPLSTNNIKQWYFIPSTQQWQHNSEFTTSNSTSSQQIHNSAIAMLVLDCSSSLGSSGFNTMKSSANNFLDILRNNNTLSAPTVQTLEATTVTDVSAILNGSVTNSGNLIIHECGFVFGLSPNMSNAAFYNANNANNFSYTVTGLTPNTTYYYRAFARNNRGIGYGPLQSFTTPTMPAVTTGGVSNVTGYSASCGGTVTSTGNATVSARGVCWSTSHNPTIAGNHTNDGTGSGSFNSSITGLNPGTTYYVRAYATNIVGTVYGNEVSFTTNVVLPEVTTTDITNNLGATATSGGTVTNAGGGTITARGVCWSTSANPTISGSHTTNGTGIGSYTSNMTGLSLNTTYYVRAYATNSAGTAYGNQLTFTTPNIPTVTTNTVGSITAYEASCGGNVTATGGVSVTAKGVCWSTSQNPTVSNSHTTDGNGTGSFTSSITGLNPGTTYYVRAYATNSAGTAYGTQRNFTTSIIEPTVTTNNTVNNITATTASCGGNVTNTGGASVTARGICWSTSPYPTVSGSHTTNGTGTGSFTSDMTELTPGTTYYLRAYATNSVGTSYGAHRSFNTLATVPTVTTNTVSNITSTSATCGGNVTATGGASVTARGVCWSTSQNPTVSDSHTTNGSGSGSFTSSITELNPGTTYYVRAYATNSVGTSYGSQGVFTTLTTPTIITDTVSNISYTTATCGGNIIFDGGATVIARGICWSTSQNPILSDNHTTSGSGTGSFTCNMTGLSLGTTYYVRAYATNSVGTVYGNEIEFTTAIRLPTVTTTSFANTHIAYNSAVARGNVTSDGGSAVTEKGICWSTSQNPTINDSYVANGGGTGGFISNLIGLSAGTTYFVRAYATNSVGTAYGNVESFFTPYNGPCSGDSTVTDIDNNMYNTIQIGNQCWMKENLRTTRYANGAYIELGSSTSTTTAYRYCPGNDGSNVSIFGYLYNWSAVMHGAGSSSANPSGIQGVCPNGWHVPSNAEWTQLTNYVKSQSEYICGGNTNYIAKSLAAIPNFSSGNQTCAITLNPTINNATGFSVVIAGSFYYGGYSNMRENTYFWSTTKYNENDIYVRNLEGNSAYITSLKEDRSYGFSIRCIRNADGLPVVNIDTLTSITTTSAICVGDVMFGGMSTVTTKGICWSTLQSPTVSDSHTTDGVGTGSFTSNMTGLLPGTTYYVRAYATNSNGTAYSTQWSFTTLTTVPTVTTNTVNSITLTSATCGGNVTSTGGSSVTARGVCWSISQNPNVNNSHTTNGSGTGSFTSYITGLTHSTTYYVRAYATNNVGTVYGAQQSFTTLAPDGSPCASSPIITDYDNNTYNTIQLGNQCWMKENLRTTHYANGASITLGSGASTTTAYRYNPNNNSSNVNTYGYLYNWAAVMHGASSSDSNPSGVQGICPNGWHVPSDAEWTQLKEYVSSQSQYQCNGNSTNIAKALAATIGWETNTNTCAVGNNSSTNNNTGFSALPAGAANQGYNNSAYTAFGYHQAFGASADFWSTTYRPDYASYSYYYSLSYHKATFERNSWLRNSAYSVRCVKDE